MGPVTISGRTFQAEGNKTNKCKGPEAEAIGFFEEQREKQCGWNILRGLQEVD